MSLGLILIIILVLVLAGGFIGPPAVGGPWYGGHPTYVGGGLGLIIVIILVLVLVGRL